MIFITGDCHAEFRRFSKENFSEQSEMTQNDVVIICGDFGGVFYPLDESRYRKELKNEDYWLDWLESKPYTTVFVAGNHENYDRLQALPVQEWNGGKVRPIRPHVLQLMNGEVYTIDKKKIFAFGGARSHDISDGILDGSDGNWREKARWLNKSGKYLFRVRGVTWWDAEMPSEEDMRHGCEVLDENGWNVDFVVTHCCASSTQAILSAGTYKPDQLTDYLEQIHSKLNFRYWFFGHYHDNKNVTSNELLLYEQIIQIA